MHQVAKEWLKEIAPLFEGIQDSMVIACLQGHQGHAYVHRFDPRNQPKAALIVSGEYSFFAGDPTSEDAIYLVKNLFVANISGTTVVIYEDEKPEWTKLLMSMAEYQPVLMPRFGIVQKDYDFDSNVLDKYMDRVSEGFKLVKFDEDIYNQAMQEEWSREFCEVFPTAEEYLSRGFGFGMLHGGKLVSGASTMTVYDGGVEIQVATDERFRGRGLAMACAAALIRECVNRKIRPCWDAANQASLHMALSLGYEYKGEYTTIQMREVPLR